ncbi:MAG: hypothetical protein ACE5HO_04340 [bacterium]
MDKFEEYKLFVEDTARFSERRQTVSNIYVAVNAIILSAIAFLAKDAGLVPLWRAFVIVLVLAAGIVICLQWDRLIYKYKLLVGFRINQLRKIEEHEEMANCHKMFHAEDALYARDSEGQPIPGESLNISDRERWLPRVFIIVYALFFIGFASVLLFRT